MLRNRRISVHHAGNSRKGSRWVFRMGVVLGVCVSCRLNEEEEEGRYDDDDGGDDDDDDKGRQGHLRLGCFRRAD